MQRYKILHRTYYNFSGTVSLGEHTLRLRPRENHDLRIESSNLNITPHATLRWLRDVEGNSVAIANFDTPTSQLLIESEVIIQQYNENPFDFLIADYATQYPFAYSNEDWLVLSPYMHASQPGESPLLADWLAGIWQAGEQSQTFPLLQRLCIHIFQSMSYQSREEPGVQSPEDTISHKSGSCRDFANLFMAASRHLGLAARFVSGYQHAEPSAFNYGSTHAWAEVYLPGAGWTGFDPTNGIITGSSHIAVAVARSPEWVPPVSGSFVGLPGVNLDVGVWVSPL